MKNSKENFSAISYLCAFIIGVILFWSFGKYWLDLTSTLVFLAGLIGVAVSVLFIGAWNIFKHSEKHDH
jgi:SNF family Na+-dependent transporter